MQPKFSLLKLVIFVVIAASLVAFGMQYTAKLDAEAEKNRREETLREEERQKKVLEQFIIRDAKVGIGKEAKSGTTLTVHYTGTFEDGEKFDSSYDRKEPIRFELGLGNVIQGWERGLPGMKEGGMRELVIPPELGYGERGTVDSRIPPNATLRFTVELLKVE